MVDDTRVDNIMQNTIQWEMSFKEMRKKMDDKKADIPDEISSSISDIRMC